MADGRVDWEGRLAALWASLDELPDETFRSRMSELVAELPDDSATGAFEQAAAFDSTGAPDLAVPLYRVALERGLDGARRRRAVIQLSSSLRNLGRPEESVALLRAERDAGSDELDDAVGAFLALALVDTGQEREAVSLALGALAPHLPRYQRSLGRYAAALSDDDGPPDRVLEQAVLDVRPGQEADFEAAFAEAKAIIAAMPGFLSLRLLRCVEAQSRYLLLVRWERLEDHTEGFRGSAGYREWRALLHRFYEPHPTVEHYRLVSRA